MDDEDARAIRLRRAQLVSAALACLVGCGDEANEHAKPTVCLSFGLVCPQGSEPRADAPRGILTNRPNPSAQCVPEGSPSSLSAARAAESAAAAESAKAREAASSAKPEASASAKPAPAK